MEASFLPTQEKLPLSCSNFIKPQRHLEKVPFSPSSHRQQCQRLLVLHNALSQAIQEGDAEYHRCVVLTDVVPPAHTLQSLLAAESYCMRYINY